MFTFESGGWNTVYATSPEEAYEVAVEKYSYSENLNPRPKSFRAVKEHRKGYEMALASFW